MGLRLTPTFVSDFNHTTEPLVILNSRMYTVHRCSKQKRDNYLSMGGLKFRLEEAVELTILEKRFLLDNSCAISSHLDNLTNNIIIPNLRGRLGNIKRLQGILLRLKEFSMQRFILEDVFEKYFELVKRKRGMTRETDISVNGLSSSNDFQIPSIEEILGSSSIFESQLERKYNCSGFVLLRGRVYALDRNNGTTPKSHVCVSGRRYTVRHIGHTSKFEQEYKQVIGDYITKRLIGRGSKYVSSLTNLEKTVAKLRKEVDRRSAINRRTYGSDGEVGFKNIDNNNYEIFLNLPKYIIEFKGEYYLFPAVRIGTRIIVGQNILSIKDYCSVLEGKRYHHPFVYSDNIICHGDNLRWNKLGVNFGDYNFSELKQHNIAGQIALILNEGKRVLTSSYFGNFVSPVQRLSPSTFSSERLLNGEWEAKRLAKQGVMIYYENGNVFWGG